MSKTSSMQRLAVLRVWLEDVKKNPKHRKKAVKNAKWLKEIEDNED